MRISSNMSSLRHTHSPRNLKYTHGHLLILIIAPLDIRNQPGWTIIKIFIIIACADRQKKERIKLLNRNRWKNSCLSLVDLQIWITTLVWEMPQLKKNQARRTQGDKYSHATSRIWMSMSQVVKIETNVIVDLWALTDIKRVRQVWVKWWM